MRRFVAPVDRLPRAARAVANFAPGANGAGGHARLSDRPGRSGANRLDPAGTPLAGRIAGIFS